MMAAESVPLPVVWSPSLTLALDSLEASPICRALMVL